MTVAMRAVLSALAALALCGCAQAYGYGYCYDPLHGPKGFYYGPLEPKPACARQAAQAARFQGPDYGGWRGPYYAGPYPAAAR
jgi:hypothetical protein